MRKLFSLLIAYIACFNIHAQTVVQWANSLEYQYNQFSLEEYSGKQVLGKPDAYPLGELNPKAFRLKSEASFGSFIVKFSNPQEVQQIIIVENNLPGRIVEVSLLDEKGNKYGVYKSTSEALKEKFRSFSINITRTPYKVVKIEVKLNSITHKGWCQIDAVGIADGEDVDVRKSFGSGKQQQAVTLNQELAYSGNKKSIGNKVNTGFIETKPIITADGKTLYFGRQNYPYNTGGKRDEQDIWYANIQGQTEWSYAAKMPLPLNNEQANGISSVSMDGNTLLLINQYNEEDVSQPGVSMSKRVKGGWEFPKKLVIKNDYNKSNFVDYFLSSDGKVLFLAVERNDSKGDQDLYVSFPEGGDNWSEPVNLGATINTASAEFSPFLAADGKTLYFASDGHNGLGGSDIFFSKRMDDTWKNWSKPKNLGSKVNGKAFEAYYTITASGDYAYFISDEAGSRDIYRIALPKEFKPEPVILISGKVFNSKTKQPIAANIIFESLDDNKEMGAVETSPENGEFKIILPKGKNYGYLALAKGFLSVEENIDASSIDNFQEVNKDLYLVPIEVGQSVNLNNIFFVKGQKDLLESSFQELSRLVKMLKDNPKIEIELGGHTDNQGNAKLNVDLSEERVKVVKKYLTDNGVADKRVSLKAYGGSKPVASNGSEETRKLNRRVEVTITKE